IRDVTCRVQFLDDAPGQELGVGAWLEFDGPSDCGSDLRSEVGYVRTTNGQASRAEWVEVERCASLFVCLRATGLLLHTVGARSGEPRTTMLAQFPEPDGSTVVVASFGGAARHSAWYVNLAKHTARCGSNAIEN